MTDPTDYGRWPENSPQDIDAYLHRRYWQALIATAMTALSAVITIVLLVTPGPARATAQVLIDITGLWVFAEGTVMAARRVWRFSGYVQRKTTQRRHAKWAHKSLGA